MEYSLVAKTNVTITIQKWQMLKFEVCAFNIISTD